MGPTRAAVLYMIVQAGKAALEQLLDPEFTAKATPEQMKAVWWDVVKGTAAEEQLNRLEEQKKEVEK